MTSPCSVSFSRPETEPGACPRIARFVGPPPRPMAPPRPWNSVSSMPDSVATVDELGLRLVEQPRRREEPGLLVRVRVAEHDLLPIAAARQVRAIRGIRQELAQDPAGVAQGIERLEQGHDVDGRRRLVAGRVAGQGQDIGRVGCREREAHDVAVTRRSPNRAWAAAIARYVARTSSSDTPGASSVSPGSPASMARQRRPMDRRVLADLQRGEMEPERAQLPAQVLQLAVRHPLQAVRDQRGFEFRELVVEGLGVV